MLPIVTLDPSVTLPADGFAGALAGRVRRPDVDAPSVVAIRADGIFDVSTDFPAMRDVCETPDPAAGLKAGAASASTRSAILSPKRAAEVGGLVNRLRHCRDCALGALGKGRLGPDRPHRGPLRL